VHNSVIQYIGSATLEEYWLDTAAVESTDLVTGQRPTGNCGWVFDATLIT